MKPAVKPNDPRFSSGPCAKRPGWSPAALGGAVLGRSHRAAVGQAKLAEIIDRCHGLLGLPADYRLGIVPASDTGAVEMALWSLLGARGVDMLAWESFGKTWVGDAVSQLGLTDIRLFEAPYGELPDLDAVDPDRDVVFTWNGTTSGVAVPNGDWIDPARGGLTICDATSAVFAMDLPWDRIDVATFSWQKALGGEAAHGMLVLSPRAVERLESHTPPWPMPKIFRLTKDGKLIDGIFRGATINTPSLLCAEDFLDALAWAQSIGGLPALIARARANLAAVAAWVDRSDWIDFLARDPATRSATSICLKFSAAAADGGDDAAWRTIAKEIGALLDREGAGYDLTAYRDAPAGLRLWGGATVETANLEAVFPWLDWAFAEATAKHSEDA